jgi:competence protein ComEC
MPFIALAFLGGASLVLTAPHLPSTAVLLALAVVALAAAVAGGRVLAAAVAGIVLVGWHGHRVLGDDWPCSRDRETVVLTGTVVSPAEEQPGRVDFELAPEPAARALGVPRRIRVAWYEPEATPRPGETWHLALRLRCRNGFANPGGFERELDLLRRGLGATAYVVAEPPPRRLADTPWSAPVQRARAWTGERIGAASLGTRSAAVLQGLSVGLRGSIDPRLRQAFVDSGTAHLIAISGTHVTAFAVVVLWLSRRAYRWVAAPGLSARWPAWQAGLVLLMTGAYGLLAGASLPTVRTVAMVACALVLRVLRRNAGAADVLACCALLLAAGDPLGVTSAGFWLSFAAVAALIGLLDTPAGAGVALRRFARAQAAVSIVLVPVLVAAFGGIPLVGPLANALAIPAFSFILLPATLLGTVLLVAAPRLAEGFWALLASQLDRCWPWLERLAGLPGAVLRPPAAPAWILSAALAASLAAVAIPSRILRWLAGVLLVVLVTRTAPAPVPGGFELVVLDVGQGLAAVVRTARRTLVFDTGPRWRGGGAAAAVTLVPYLRSAGVVALDTVVVSHADGDHAGGLPTLVEAFRPRWVIGDPGEAGTADEPCVAGRRWSWDGVGFEILHPPAAGAWPGNDGSCALKVTGVNGAVLLLADPEGAAERAMLQRGAIGADAVLVPHHGSRSSSSPEFIRETGATWALVSAGFGNRWGLPRPKVVARWREAGAEVLDTAQGGALRLQAGPEWPVPRLEAWRDADPRWWRRR